MAVHDVTATLGSYGQVRSTETFDTLNPATNEVIGTYPIFNAQDVAATVERAQAAAQWWADLGWKARRQRLLAWKSYLTRYIGRLAELVHNETGKPLADAQLEILLAIVHIDWAAKIAPGARPAPRAERPGRHQPCGDSGIPAARCGGGDRPMELPGFHSDGVDRIRTCGGERGCLQAQ